SRGRPGLLNRERSARITVQSVMVRSAIHRPTAREIATRALIPAAAEFPSVTPRVLNTGGLRDDDARLALAIHRTVLQRWLTLEHLLNRHLAKPLQQLEPAMRATLLAG